MAMTLKQAIDFSIAPPWPAPNGIGVSCVLTMHDDNGLVASAGGSPERGSLHLTFRANVPLLNHGPVNIDTSTGLAGTSWFAPTQVPGFSTRGQGGLWVVWPSYEFPTATSAYRGPPPGPIDLSVRRDPGWSGFSRFPGLGPSVQIEIEVINGFATHPGRGVTLKATEDGPLVRAIGPSFQDYLDGEFATRAVYTFSVSVWPKPGPDDEPPGNP